VAASHKADSAGKLLRFRVLVQGVSWPYKGLRGRFRGSVVSDPKEGGQDKEQSGTGLVLEEATPRLKRPPMFRVLLINDDYTPMEFVVDVLQRVFGHDRPKATRIMLEVHTRGRGICGVFTFEIAETKVAQVTSYARQHQHPLLCTMEEA